ncbi:uncharacterized protein A1O5_12682 [Cladophialophora psammophila CBS 110553]|uniref:Major facilitator superfamily (MFS) profile domain-containing protein n=1 Tax=Cladophialophora psammophila CBS 110553 TaxID=1182543 RepID=W9VVJ3_9EURO|nr:uncharacterized protein A1O5_12682 [Cladophialophora psammophila CBS 110553]EXJ56226.1 hypothetical protein A1O5_12682 [Cladophialophora psammophila CBS 110553]
MFIIAGCTLAIFTDSFLYGIVVPVFPFILVERAGIAPSNVGPWTSALLACYAGTSLIVCPIAGYMTDYFSLRRTTFVIGLAAQASATVLLCTGSSIAILTLGRILQGASSAITWTAGLTLASDTVGKDEIGRTMGFCSLGMSLAMFVSPLVGGVLFEHSGYNSVFGPAFVLLSVDIIWRLTIIEGDVTTQRTSSRGQGYWTFAYGDHGTPSIIPSPLWQEVPGLELLSPRNQEFGLENPFQSENITLVTQQLSHTGQRIRPWIIILRDIRLQVALWASLVQVTLTTSLDAVLPLFVHRVFSWGPQGAGLIFIPVVAPSLLAVCIGKLTDKFGPKWLVSVGFLAAVPAYILLRLVKDDNVGQAILLCFLLSLLSTAMTFVCGPLMAEITLAVEARERSHPGISGPRGAIARAHAFYFVFVSGGLLVGPLWAGMVEKVAGWETMTCTFGLFSGLMVIPTSLFTGGVIKLRGFTS